MIQRDRRHRRWLRSVVEQFLKGAASDQGPGKQGAGESESIVDDPAADSDIFKLVDDARHLDYIYSLHAWRDEVETELPF
jgi:hypothetical protein